jgi:5-methylcytosine-specific restriction enzyme A
MTPRLTTLRPRVEMASQRLTPSPKVADPIYQTPAWRTLIAAIIEQRGRRCEDPKCKTPGRTGMRVFGDHIKELKDGGALLDPRNISGFGAAHATRQRRSPNARRGWRRDGEG